jgi:multidrug resistance efflux pump
LIGSIVIGVSIIAGVLTHNRTQRPPANSGQKAAPGPAVNTSAGIGAQIQAQHTVNVPAPISGTLEQFHVDVGQDVFEGQLLAQIRSQSLNVSQEEADLAVERAQDKVNKLEAAIIAARLEASRARADASRANSEYTRTQRIHQRQRMLLTEGATPKVAAQKAEKDFLAAELEWNSLDAVAKGVEERVDALLKEHDNAKKALAHMQEAQETVKVQVAAGEVHSPVNGVVIARRGEQGGNVDQSLQDMFRIAIDLAQLEAVADVDTRSLNIQPGQPAVVHIPENSEAIPGTVKTVEPNRVVVEFTAGNAAVKPGLSAQVTFPQQPR